MSFAEVRRASVAIVAVNVLGALLYLWQASAAWAIPAERAAGISTVTGEPFVWALAVFPVWGAFLLLNGAWATFAREKAWRVHTLSWLAVAAVWVTAMLVDFAHH
jgi:hypothetical protein